MGTSFRRAIALTVLIAGLVVPGRGRQGQPDVFEPLRTGAIVDADAFRRSLPCARIALRSSGSPVLAGTGWSVELFRDGRATLEAGPYSWFGTGSVDGWRGSFHGRSDAWDFGRLCEFIVGSGLESLQARYSVSVGDLVTTTVMVELPTRRVAIEDYGEAGPPTLWAVRSAIELVARRIHWQPAGGAAR